MDKVATCLINCLLGQMSSHLLSPNQLVLSTFYPCMRNWYVILIFFSAFVLSLHISHTFVIIYFNIWHHCGPVQILKSTTHEHCTLWKVQQNVYNNNNIIYKFQLIGMSTDFFLTIYSNNNCYQRQWVGMPGVVAMEFLISS